MSNGGPPPRQAAGLQESPGSHHAAGHAEEGGSRSRHLLDTPLAEEVKRDPTLKLAFSGGIGNFVLDFFDMWDTKSPRHERRVRLATNYAIDRQALNEAEKLGASLLTGSIVPRNFEFPLPIESYSYDPAKAKQRCV